MLVRFHLLFFQADLWRNLCNCCWLIEKPDFLELSFDFSLFFRPLAARNGALQQHGIRVRLPGAALERVVNA